MIGGADVGRAFNRGTGRAAERALLKTADRCKQRIGVIGAARDVATQATTRAQIDAQRAQRAREIEAALRMQNSAAARVRQGLDDSRSELMATESWIEQRDAMLQLDSAALSADVALQRALGGGYESPQKLANSTPTTAAP